MPQDSGAAIEKWDFGWDASDIECYVKGFFQETGMEKMMHFVMHRLARGQSDAKPAAKLISSPVRLLMRSLLGGVAKRQENGRRGSESGFVETF
jgi:hypothetical protein